MRAAEASQFAKKFDDDDGALLKPQWLQRTSGTGISNQFRSADQFRGRGGRKFGGDDRRPRGPSPKVSSPASSDFPPLAPFYRSHSTGSLTPADIPSASSRLLSASKEENTFSINRECDFPTLATAAAVVEQPARMHKSKSATALPQSISPSSDLLKAHHTTLAALAGPVVSSAPPPSAAASSPALAPAVTAGPEPLPPTKQTHKKKPSFSDKVSFSEIAATEKAASNKDKFQQTMANSRAELQRFKSLVPSKPVHPSLANRPSIRPFQPKVRPKMPMPTASATVLKAPDSSLMTMIPPTSPATMRKATSAPVLPMSTTLLPRSPPNPSPLSTICTSSSIPSSSSSSRDSAHHPAAAAAPSSPPRPALLSSSQSARTLPQASSASSSGGAWAETSFAPRQHFALPLASSRFSFANGASSSGGSTVSPRRRDSSPATSTVNGSSSSSSPCSSSAASPLTSPRRSSVTSVMALVQQESDAMIGTMGIYSSSAPLSPRMATVGSNGGSSGNALSSSGGGKTGKKPLRHSGSAASASAASSSSKPASNGGTRQRRRSVKSSSSSSSTAAAATNGGSRRQSADDGEPAAAANGQVTVHGFGVALYQASTCDNTASSSSSSGSSSDDDLLLEAEYDRVNDDELMMIATGVTSITATSIAGVHLEPRLPPDDDDVADHHHQSSQSSLLAGINGDAGGLSSLKDEFCPFSWEMRADGEEWSEFSEEAVSGFMKTLGYVAQDDGARGLDGDDDDGEGLTEEEIRLAKQQIERATLQQLLEKKKQGLSESLKNWQPPHIPGSGSGSPAATAAAPSAGSALASSSPSSSSSSSPSSSSSTSPTLLRHHPRPAASLSASSAGGGRRGHHQPLRSSSGPTPSSSTSSSSSSHGRRNHQHSHSQQQQLQQDLLALVDSDSDESDCEEEVHGFHGIVFG